MQYKYLNSHKYAVIDNTISENKKEVIYVGT